MLVEPPASPAVDLLAQIEQARSLLAADSPTRTRLAVLWAAAKKARKVAAADVAVNAFMALAIETGLIDEGGRWRGADVAEHCRRYGARDVEHVIRWALRGRNPFEEGH